MRLFSNLLVFLLRDGSPLPRFWYFPDRYRAVLVMAGDDHGDTVRPPATTRADDPGEPRGCDVARWECYRATAWMYPRGGLSPGRRGQVRGPGNRRRRPRHHRLLGLDASLSERRLRQGPLGVPRTLSDAAPAAGKPPPLHRLDRGLRQADLERGWGVRFDMNYYYWPDSWLKGRPGFMTGSGLPMRFTRADGRVIDVYQQETHLVDEVSARPSNPAPSTGCWRGRWARKGISGRSGRATTITSRSTQMLIAAAGNGTSRWSPLGSCSIGWRDERKSGFRDLELDRWDTRGSETHSGHADPGDAYRGAPDDVRRRGPSAGDQARRRGRRVGVRNR